MKKMHFEDFEDFACEIADSFDEVKDNEELNDISIIAMPKDVQKIISELIVFGYNISSIDFDVFYEVPSIITLSNIDEDYEIWCEPFERNGTYLIDESAITYVMSNCPSSCLKTIESRVVVEVSVGKCDEQCSCVNECCVKNKTVQPTEKNEVSSTSSYKVNGKEVSREEFETFKKKVDDEYLDTVRNMLLKHCSIMDEINEMSRLLRW